MALVDIKALKHYLSLNYNVLFIGLHGVGKTAIVKEVFESMGYRWRYYSCPTLDPWVDLVGIPRVVGDGDNAHIKLVKPLFIQNDECDALFLDEFNRAPDKVINAVMELIQFKTINGHPLNNLKVIWAAINPEDDDDTYAVNHLDPAQVDRFQVHIKVPYKPDKEYFLGKYPGVGQTFLDWWDHLPNDIKRKVSPRRLDYAAAAFLNKCRLEDLLPVEANVKALRDSLQTLPFQSQLMSITSLDEAIAFLKNVNNATKLLEMVKRGDKASIDFFTQYGMTMPKELVEPFAEVVYAKKQGVDLINTVEELIERFSATGDQGMAAMINNTDFTLIEKNNGSIENDLRALLQTKRHVVIKLANRLADVMMRCQASTLERIFWGSLGRSGNKPSNFQRLAEIVGRLDDGKLFTHQQRTFINSKLYDRKITGQRFL